MQSFRTHLLSNAFDSQSDINGDSTTEYVTRILIASATPRYYAANFIAL